MELKEIVNSITVERDGGIEDLIMDAVEGLAWVASNDDGKYKDDLCISINLPELNIYISLKPEAIRLWLKNMKPTKVCCTPTPRFHYLELTGLKRFKFGEDPTHDWGLRFGKCLCCDC